MLYPHRQPHTQKIYHALFVTMKYLKPVLSNVWSQFYGCLKWWCLLITTVQMHFKYHPQIYFHNAYFQWHHCAVLFIHLFFSYLLNNHKLLNELYLHCFQLLSCDYITILHGCKWVFFRTLFWVLSCASTNAFHNVNFQGMFCCPDYRTVAVMTRDRSLHDRGGGVEKKGEMRQVTWNMLLFFFFSSLSHLNYKTSRMEVIVCVHVSACTRMRLNKILPVSTWSGQKGGR